MTESMTTQPQARKVIVDVDTHKHVHVAVAIDTWGIRLGDQSFVADSGGYQALITWAEAHGPIEAFGIEGTGSYGAGLAGTVRQAGHRVVEVNRGDRRTRRAAGTSDTVDAEVAARSVLAGQSTATPKTADGAVEMMRQLKVARDTAVKARTTAMITLKQIIVYAPPPLREALHALLDHGLLTRCAGLRPGPLDTRASARMVCLAAAAQAVSGVQVAGRGMPVGVPQEPGRSRALHPQPGSHPDHATLGYGWWLACAVAGLAPAGFLQEVSVT